MLVAKASSLSPMHPHSGVSARTPGRIAAAGLHCGLVGAPCLGFFSPSLPIPHQLCLGLFSVNGNRRCPPRLSFSPRTISTLLPIVSSLWRLYSSGKDELDTVESLATDNEGIPTLENLSVATEVPGEVTSVKFVLEKQCHFGQRFNVVGNDPLFGDWDPKASVPMTWSEGHIWSVELDVPVGKMFEYKLILTGKRGEVEWQPGPNRSFDTSGSIPLSLYETWSIDDGITELSKGDALEEDTAEATEDETVTEEEDTAEAAKTETIMEDDTGEAAENQTVTEEDANEVEDKMMADEASSPSAVEKCVAEIAETMGAIPELESSRDGTSITG